VPVTDGPAAAATVLLVRHASAGDATTWRGADADRPLDERGRQQAAEIAAVLPSYQPVRVIAAPPVRCVDTVSAVAEAAGVPLEVDPLFGEDGAPADPDQHLLEVVVPGSAVVVCSQGGVIPRTLELLGVERERIRVRKGSVWTLTLQDGRLLRAEEGLPS
jgi:8-oxo-dGTP diphosphatase